MIGCTIVHPNPMQQLLTANDKSFILRYVYFLMIEELQMELFSRTFVSAVATAALFESAKTGALDIDSVDTSIYSHGAHGTKKSPQIDVQLKCTYRDDLMHADGMHYPLTLKNYNDLKKEVVIPRLLIVVVVPRDLNTWLNQTPAELILKNHAYWRSLKGEPDTANTSNVTVLLPSDNVFTPATLIELMRQANAGTL